MGVSVSEDILYRVGFGRSAGSAPHDGSMPIPVQGRRVGKLRGRTWPREGAPANGSKISTLRRDEMRLEGC